MNWIGTWCKARCDIGNSCDNCRAQCLPRMRIASAVGCSEGLIWILMNEAGGVTHHAIADRIADYLGATAEQRDSIVHKTHKGTYKPNTTGKPQRFSNSYCAQSAKSVVAINRFGKVIKRYDSIKAAADSARLHGASVTYRCNRLCTAEDEFKDLGMTFRFEEDWNNMTYEEKMNDIMRRSDVIGTFEP